MPFSKKSLPLYRTLRFGIVAITILVMTAGCKDGTERDAATSNTSKTAFAKAETTLNATTQTTTEKQRSISQQWKDYWYAGEAEITSYTLEQARYGEIREGTAALIFVTEDFLPTKQVKADGQSDTNIPVLKLNATKKFNTGIYPYSVMNSTFYPVYSKGHAIKITQSMQEWCGHSFIQLNNRASFEVQSRSYFESEADKAFDIPKVALENELWTLLRIDPSALPTGNFDAVPDFSFSMMKHAELKIYLAKGTLTSSSYTLVYPELERTIKINFSATFPHTIESWEETYPDGRGGQKLTTRATKIKTIKSAYWSKNSNADASLRKNLGLN